MFVFTFHKNTLRRVAAMGVCLGCLAGTVAGVSYLADRSVAAAAGTGVVITGTQDIGSYFSQYGVELDLSTAGVDSVKIPKRWDDSFLAFNTVVSKSGMSLEGYKGKTVEKWTALCPGRSAGEEKTYGVMLVYKEQAIGAYLLTQPGGEVTGLDAPQGAMDEADAMAEAAEAASALMPPDGAWPIE